MFGQPMIGGYELVRVERRLAHAVKALKEHQARVARKGDDDLVFGNRKGDPMRESSCS